MPGNVCSTTKRAPGVTPSASRRSARPSPVARTSTITPRPPSATDESGNTDRPCPFDPDPRLELNAKVMEDIVQCPAREDRDGRDDADDREARLQPALADHHQKVRDARHEQRHDGQRD